ncbi:hypothetical protein H0E87_016271 [Populus deltoides]|uniref:non-specific serine/threonine protein kinase n=1 Tax=Populus deltoides TaxID=3696 RepID=A0A8T2Y8B6_POPDE|nr:hypothetical protein H0E87_016271 [Populus deltoides]
MTKLHLSSAVLSVTTLSLLSFILSSPFLTYALGSGSTLAVISATSTVCGVAASQPSQSITCYRRTPIAEIITVQPNVSFSAISGGSSFFCGLRSGGYAFLCWDTSNFFFESRRVYVNNTALLQNLSVGDHQVCAIINDTSSVNKTGTVRCWRGDGNASKQSPSEGDKFKSISSGSGFSCGILMENNRIKCWGNNTIAREIELGFADMIIWNLEVGGLHVCGVNSSGVLVCKGDNSFGQLNVPSNNALEYSQLALGASHSCAIRRNNGSVVCWGGGGEYNVSEIQGVFFESIVSGSNFSCGLVSRDFSIMCWGPGWPNASGTRLPLGEVLPGPCVQSSCSECGFGLNSRSSTIRRQSSRVMRRQRSGTSSKHGDRAEEFSLAELAAATNNFSVENKIGAGSFGVVYGGKLKDGREVAIKRGETGQKMKKFQEKESTPTSIVDFAVPKLMVNELGKILDPRVGPPELNEAEAVELVGYTAMHCVNLEGKDRPTMTDIVANLERALSLCDSSSHGSISSGRISIVSD